MIEEKKKGKVMWRVDKEIREMELYVVADT